MALHELVYVSLAVHEMSSHELTALLDESRTFNASHGITGLLIYRSQEFMQLIEGEQNEVLCLFGRIERDPRHRQVDRLWDGPISQRSCTGWAMGFAEPDEPTLRTLPGGTEVLDDGMFVGGRATVGKRFLLSLRDEVVRHRQAGFGAPRGPWG